MKNYMQLASKLWVFGVLVLSSMVSAAEYVIDLTAGGGDGVGTKVGTVTINDNLVGNNLELSVYYRIDTDNYPDWVITETHVDIGVDGDKSVTIAVNKKGNPKIGRFDYSATHSPSVQEYEEYIVLDSNAFEPGAVLSIAAHAVVEEETISDPDILDSNLPETAVFSIPGAPSPGDFFYFTDIDVSEAGILTGLNDGWCADESLFLSANTPYLSSVYSTVDIENSIEDEIVVQPWNMFRVNWLLNQNIVNTNTIGLVETSCPAGGPYTYGDLQQAIWALIDDVTFDIDGNPTGQVSGGTDDGCRSNEIYQAALAVGEYTVECGDFVGVILEPQSDASDPEQKPQPVLFGYPLECGNGSETAWGGVRDGGEQFSQKNGWAVYYEITL